MNEFQEKIDQLVIEKKSKKQDIVKSFFSIKDLECNTKVSYVCDYDSSIWIEFFFLQVNSSGYEREVCFFELSLSYKKYEDNPYIEYRYEHRKINSDITKCNSLLTLSKICLLIEDLKSRLTNDNYLTILNDYIKEENRINDEINELEIDQKIYLENQYQSDFLKLRQIFQPLTTEFIEETIRDLKNNETNETIFSFVSIIRNNNKIEFKNSVLIAKKHKRLSLFLNEESIPQKELNNILNTAFLINGQLVKKVSDLNNIGINKDRSFTTTIDKLKEQFKAGLNILEF